MLPPSTTGQVSAMRPNGCALVKKRLETLVGVLGAHQFVEVEMDQVPMRILEALATRRENRAFGVALRSTRELEKARDPAVRITCKGVFGKNLVDETHALGVSIGKLLRPADVLLLHGELGSGKTV